MGTVLEIRSDLGRFKLVGKAHKEWFGSEATLGGAVLGERAVDTGVVAVRDWLLTPTSYDANRYQVELSPALPSMGQVDGNLLSRAFKYHSGHLEKL